MKKILIGTPVKQKSNILTEFLKSLDELDLKDYDVYYYFIDDNTDEKSSEVLKKFGENKPNFLIKYPKDFQKEDNPEYECNESTHIWKENLIARITAYKDDIIKYARENGMDYLFLVDSDIVLNPQTIKHLASRNVDIVSEVFWTSWTEGARLAPQVWLQDDNHCYIKDWGKVEAPEEIKQSELDFINMVKIPGIYKVGGLGACTLISKNAISKDISFSTIDNLSYLGEDRHFCIRARALGLELYVDTVYPAYHIYRENYLQGVEEYKKNGFDPNLFVYNPMQNKVYMHKRFEKFSPKRLVKKVKPFLKKVRKAYYLRKRRISDTNKLVLSMVVKNEEKRYLREMLTDAIQYVDEVLIIDDASTDGTVKLCEEILKDKPHKIIVNEKSMFSNEVSLRKKQWKETLKLNPDWILFLDADEIFENKMKEQIKYLLKNRDVDAYCFRLYDMWDKDHYRNDEYWHAHRSYGTFLIRYQPKFRYKFLNQKHHCGRMPKNVLVLDYARNPLRLKHLGWMKEEDRIEKYNRYMKLDPGAKYGIMAQYESILDKNPKLERFEDEN